MATVTAAAVGSFCWPELATTDQKAATSFYSKLLGWSVDDQPMGPGETYSMFKVSGRDAGAACTLRPEERQHGIPPHWNAYVKVDSADATAKKAEQLGAKVIAPPFDVMEAGRMAVLQDPTGAYFCLWEGKKHQGISAKREIGALCWTELSTGDTKTAQNFYSQLFGWTLKPSTMPGMEYTEFIVGGAPEGGIMPLPKDIPNVPPNWLPYFQVSNVDQTVATAAANGGKTIVPPTDIPNTGRFSVQQDPQGAVFALFTPRAS